MNLGIGERIRQRRLELGLTQGELAARMGYKSKAAICKVENGEDNITTDRITKFANALNCESAYLMGWETDPAIIPDDTVKASRIREIYKLVPEEYLDDPAFVKQIMQVVNDYVMTDPSDPTKELQVEAIKTYRDIQELSPEKRSQLETYLRFLQSQS